MVTTGIFNIIHVKGIILSLLSVLFLLGCQGESNEKEMETTQPEAPKITFTNEMQKISYAIGLDHGTTGRMYYNSEQLRGKFSLQSITEGMSDYLTGAPLRIQPQALDSIFNLYLKENGNVDSSVVSCADGSYAMGINEGNALVASLVARKIDQEVVVDLLVQGIKDGMLAQPTAIPYNEAKIELVAYYSDINLGLGEEFLANNKLREGVQVTESGLQYEVFKKGNGPKPNLIDSVLVHYTGKYIDGRDFESTIPSQKPIKINLLEVIPGWTEGIQLMNEGGQYRFFLPHQLAFGEEGSTNVEPFSVLVYDIELVKVY